MPSVAHYFGKGQALALQEKSGLWPLETGRLEKAMWRERPILAPIDLGIILSYKCNSACKHCLYACGPRWEGWMTVDDLERALDAAEMWRDFVQIHLTGGEPFLNFDLLVEATRRVAERGFPQFVETNAYWCKDKATGLERFRILHDAGMNAVLISCSPFQSERIPLRRVLYAIESALEVFGPRGVMVYQTQCINWVAEFSVDEPVPLEAYIERYGPDGAGRLFWLKYNLIPGGRSGFTLGHLTARHPPEAFEGENCEHELLHPHHSHFDLYGNHISWFCGGLSVGRWDELEQTVKEFSEGKFPPPVDVLVREGPFGLYKIARDKYGFTPSPDGYVGKCHLCVDVRRHLAKTGHFPALRPEGFYENLLVED